MTKILVDFESGTVSNGRETHSLSDSKGFKMVSDAWLRAGWDSKYPYSFTWLGRPIIQTPEDMIRIQELIYTIKPDIIIETGIAHGGSLIYYASLMDLIKGDRGKVIGIDIKIRKHNRKAIERQKNDFLSPIIMIEGSSVDINIFNEVKKHITPEDVTLIILDSNHTKEHVLKELYLYSELVSINSYIIACDGKIKELVVGGPRTEPDWDTNNPKQAAKKFVENNSNFIIEEPKFLFNEGVVDEWVSYYSGGFIKKLNNTSI